MRVLIAGCGYVGSALAERLVQRGDSVLVLSRSGRFAPAGAQSMQKDLAEPGLVLPSDVDAVVFTAAADGHDDDAYRRIYVDGLRNLLAASGSARRVLFSSSTGVYGQGDGVWVDEKSETSPSGFTGARMLEAETLLAASGLSGVAVRFGGIYGPGRTRLIDTVRRGEAVRYGGAPEYTNRIHKDDCAGVLAHLLDLRKPARVYNAVDIEPAPRDQMMSWLATQLGVPPLPLGERPVRQRSESNKRVSSQLLCDSGYRFVYPTYRDGYGAMLGLG